MSMVEKRERLMTIVTMREKKRTGETSMLEIGDKKDSKNADESTKREKLNAQTYKKLFEMPGKEVNMSQECDHIAATADSNEVDNILAEKSCPGSSTKKPRVALDSEKVCSGNRESVNDPSQDGDHTVLKTHGFESKSNTLEFEEYWVPVHLSSMQIDQYCSLLGSNLEALSCLKNSPSLHDILTQTRKCCDHPYLVDPILRNTSKSDLIDPFSAEINVSGKLQLLDKLLLEIKRLGLKTLVLFQPVISSEKISIGDILDDLVDQRFGQDYYIRIEGKILSKSMRTKRKEELFKFNSVESQKFVCLQDYPTCHSSIVLSHVDVVILFNSDWNPLKSLQKITIDSQCKQVKVFRLYSTFTTEEKALILAKQGRTLESSLDRINWHTCHQLLAWGASYLFTELRRNTESGTSSNQSFIDNLVQELSSMLQIQTRNSVPLNCSVISKAQLHDGVYFLSVLLLGEAKACAEESSLVEDYLIEDEPRVFWSNLLKESHHSQTQKNSSSSRLSRRLHKSSRNPYHWFEGSEADNEDNLETFKNIVSDATTSPSVKTKLTERKVHAGVKQREPTGMPAGFGGQQSSEGEMQRESLSFDLNEPYITDSVIEGCNNQPPVLVTPPDSKSSTATIFETELVRIQNDREQALKLHQGKKSMLVFECEEKMSEMIKKYDELVESEMCLSKKLKVFEEYHKRVDANRQLAETLLSNCYDTLAADA